MQLLLNRPTPNWPEVAVEANHHGVAETIVLLAVTRDDAARPVDLTPNGQEIEELGGAGAIS